MSQEDLSIMLVIHEDKEDPVAELFYKDEQVAEIFFSNEQLTINLFPSSSQDFWTLPLAAFQRSLEEAKNKLLGLS